jgi:hypothetical protein
MEEEQIRPQQTKDDLRARVNIQNKLIEQQQKHIDSLEKINQAQEQQLALFVITTSKEKDEVIDLPQWKETFVMAPASHFGCYQLQGSTFVSVDKGSICF